ncbi:hypothetical protein D927_01072, partial [Enterococcus faecalis 02-MB-BW-10]
MIDSEQLLTVKLVNNTKKTIVVKVKFNGNESTNPVFNQNNQILLDNSTKKWEFISLKRDGYTFILVVSFISLVLGIAGKKGFFSLLGKAERKKAIDVACTIKNLLSSISMDKRKTLIPDRGQEFAHYERISNENHINCYFADPSSPWQRGINENTNGLVRKYLPKSVDMTPISVTFKINNRPRKC